jgi:hypothetical protein
MNTLFHAELSEREFSSHLLHVADLLAWAESKRLYLRTSPALDGFEFVQVEALLCAIERQANDLTPEQAAEIVLNHPVLKNDPVVTRYPDDVDPTTCRWLLGADAHKKWRDLLSGAIERHELTLLDFASKLPIDTAPATDTATPAPVVVTDWRNAVRAEAWEKWVKTLAENGTPTLENVSVYLASWCDANQIMTDTGKTPKSSYLKIHVIDGKHWNPPRNMSREAAKKHLEQKEHAKQAN